jgi:hypothetical protein
LNLLHLDKNELNALLLRKEDRIGFDNVTELVNLASGYSLLMALPGIKSKIFFLICLVLGVLLIIISSKHMFLNFKHPFSADDLYAEILQMDKVERRSSIIAIKDTFETYPHKYLLYFDEGWKCDFFPNHKTAEKGNTEELRGYLSEELEVPASQIHLDFLHEFTNEKPSVEHDNQMRLYIYSIYKAEISDIPDSWKTEHFMIAGKNYRWMSIDEMLQDSTIRDINQDVIAQVRDYD